MKISAGFVNLSRKINIIEYKIIKNSSYKSSHAAKALPKPDTSSHLKIRADKGKAAGHSEDFLFHNTDCYTDQIRRVMHNGGSAKKAPARFLCAGGMAVIY